MTFCVFETGDKRGEVSAIFSTRVLVYSLSRKFHRNSTATSTLFHEVRLGRKDCCRKGGKSFRKFARARRNALLLSQPTNSAGQCNFSCQCALAPGLCLCVSPSCFPKKLTANSLQRRILVRFLSNRISERGQVCDVTLVRSSASEHNLAHKFKNTCQQFTHQL